MLLISVVLSVARPAGFKRSVHMERLVWIATLARRQRWGNHGEGRYSTDWSAAAARHTQDQVDAEGLPLPNRIIGCVMCKPDVVYDTLTEMSDAQQSQYAFWQAVFGRSLHGSLFFKLAMCFCCQRQLTSIIEFASSSKLLPRTSSFIIHSGSSTQ